MSPEPDESLSPNERRWEQELQALRPTSPTLALDRLMFEAGRRAGRRQTRHWQTLCALLAVALAAFPYLRPAASRIERIAQAPVKSTDTKITSQKQVQESISSSPVPEEFDPSAVYVRGQPATSFGGSDPDAVNYLALRDRVLTHGLDALPLPPAGGGSPPPATLRDLRRQLLPETTVPTPSSWNLNRLLNIGGQS